MTELLAFWNIKRFIIFLWLLFCIFQQFFSYCCKRYYWNITVSSYNDLSLSYFLLNFPTSAIFISIGDFHVIVEAFTVFPHLWMWWETLSGLPDVFNFKMFNFMLCRFHFNKKKLIKQTLASQFCAVCNINTITIFPLSKNDEFGTGGELV